MLRGTSSSLPPPAVPPSQISSNPRDIRTRGGEFRFELCEALRVRPGDVVEPAGLKDRADDEDHEVAERSEVHAQPPLISVSGSTRIRVSTWMWGVIPSSFSPMSCTTPITSPI